MTKSLMPGVEETLLSTESTGDVKGDGYAIPPAPSGQARTLTWASKPGTAPDAISVKIEAALNDLDAEYAQLDVSTATSGELKSVTVANYRFIRGRATSRTNGTTSVLTAMIS